MEFKQQSIYKFPPPLEGDRGRLPDTAVVILNWNGEKMLRQFLPSVVEHTRGAAVVVADNASTDGSLRLLEDEFPGVRTIVFEENHGFAEGYNRAIAELCKGEDAPRYVVLLNSDVEVSPCWLEPMVRFMDKHPEVAAVQPKLLAYHDRGSFEYAGAAGGFVDKYGYPFCRGRVMKKVEKDHGQYDTPLEIHWATGACMLIRTADYLDAGGLDARFFAHNEEIDLCWRLRIRGRKIYCLPESRVWHVGGGTLPQGNPRKTYLNFRNNLTMLYKNLPESRLRPVMRARYWLDRLAIIQSLLKGNLADAKAIIRARRDFCRWRDSYQTVRAAIQASRTLPPDKDTADYTILL